MNTIKNHPINFTAKLDIRQVRYNKERWENIAKILGRYDRKTWYRYKALCKWRFCSAKIWYILKHIYTKDPVQNTGSFYGILKLWAVIIKNF